MGLLGLLWNCVHLGGSQVQHKKTTTAPTTTDLDPKRWFAKPLIFVIWMSLGDSPHLSTKLFGEMSASYHSFLIK